MNYSIFTVSTVSASIVRRYAPYVFGFSIWFLAVSVLGAIRLIQHLHLCLVAFAGGFIDGYSNGHLEGQFTPLSCDINRYPSCSVNFPVVEVLEAVETVLLEIIEEVEPVRLEVTEASILRSQIETMDLVDMRAFAKSIGLKFSHNLGKIKLQSRLKVYYAV